MIAAATRPPVMDLLAQRMLFDAVLALVWRALGRYGFSDADRKDLAQDVAIAAFRRHLSYRAERGSPRQWLSGILRREVKRFLRLRNRQPWFATGDELPDTADGTETPEDEVSRRDLAEHVFAMLPAEERRVVILVELDHLTLREVAERERISPSTAYERHQRGMAALREAAEAAHNPDERRGHRRAGEVPDVQAMRRRAFDAAGLGRSASRCCSTDRLQEGDDAMVRPSLLPEARR
jgi:RNA polymerase sigma factor (sigma-70 family)